jgi:hypothetical protein
MGIAGERPVSQQGLASGAGNIMAQARQGFAQAQNMPVQKPNQMPSGMPPQQGMAMSPQQGAGQQPFNIQQAVAQGLQAAGQTTAGGLGYQAPQLATTNLDPYMNPYESQVVGQTLSDLERSRQMQQNMLGAQAGAAGAFGGSRQGIAEAETNRAFAEQAARTASQLRAAGFGQAQQAAMADISNRMLGQQRQQQAAGQLADIANLGFGLGRQANLDLAQQGMMQQALQQQLMDAARQQYAGFQQSPYQALQTQMAGLQASDLGNRTTTSQKQAGLFDYLSLGVAAMNPAASLFSSLAKNALAKKE